MFLMTKDGYHCSKTKLGFCIQSCQMALDFDVSKNSIIKSRYNYHCKLNLFHLLTRWLYWHLRVMLCMIYFCCTLRRFLKLSSLRNWNIALWSGSRSYREFLSKNVMTGADTYLTHALFRAIYIIFLFIFKIIPEIAFGKHHDPGQITYLTEKPERRRYYCGGQKIKTDKKLS